MIIYIIWHSFCGWFYVICIWLHNKIGIMSMNWNDMQSIYCACHRCDACVRLCPKVTCHVQNSFLFSKYNSMRMSLLFMECSDNLTNHITLLEQHRLKSSNIHLKRKLRNIMDLIPTNIKNNSHIAQLQIFRFTLHCSMLYSIPTPASNTITWHQYLFATLN